MDRFNYNTREVQCMTIILDGESYDLAKEKKDARLCKLYTFEDAVDLFSGPFTASGIISIDSISIGTTTSIRAKYKQLVIYQNNGFNNDSVNIEGLESVKTSELTNKVEKLAIDEKTSELAQPTPEQSSDLAQPELEPLTENDEDVLIMDDEDEISTVISD
jgi:hypothetical protein